MARTAVYTADVTWAGEHWGNVKLGNGPEMSFSAPPDSQGHSGVLTPEDAFVAAVNTCIMMMFLWSCERLKLDLVAYVCRGEGTKEIALDRTETFTQVRLYPEITVRAEVDKGPAETERRVHKALAAARKYSLIASSVTSEVVVAPAIIVQN